MKKILAKIVRKKRKRQKQSESVFRKFKLTYYFSTIRVQSQSIECHETVSTPIIKFYQRNAFKSFTSSIFDDRSKLPRYSQKYLDIFTKAYPKNFQQQKKKRKRIQICRKLWLSKIPFFRKNLSNEGDVQPRKCIEVYPSIQLTGTSERERMVARFWHISPYDLE